ncbi:hypothetical protein ACAW74_27735 [Fibrella sp. WM1]|uniref:hypothetical protein n=1 Tax=Fibrella musci TaxID=3242485 RepID=UPI003522497C
MTNVSALIPTETVLHFIRCYRRLEQLPLEDGFAELACVSTDPDEASEQQLRKHFRAHWYSKERAFGRFYLNLPHYRQLYLLHHWEIVHYEDATYLWECQRDSRYALVGPPPLLVRQIHELALYFENHGISLQPSLDVTLPSLPQNFALRFGNTANWGDYLLALPEPEAEAVISQMLNRDSRT